MNARNAEMVQAEMAARQAKQHIEEAAVRSAVRQHINLMHLADHNAGMPRHPEALATLSLSAAVYQAGLSAASDTAAVVRAINDNTAAIAALVAMLSEHLPVIVARAAA